MTTDPERKTITVGDLLKWKQPPMPILSANPEYQRGSVWTEPQQKRLVDSVMRGYPIPLIYLHHIRDDVAGAKRDFFEIIDGQQRIEALHKFRQGKLKPVSPVR